MSDIAFGKPADDRRAGWSRREFATAAAAVGLVPMTFGGLAGQASAAENIRVMTWAFYHVPELQQAYLEKWGTAPESVLIGDSDEEFQKAYVGGGYDTAHIDIDQVGRFYDAELLAPVDVSRLSHWPELFDEVRNLDYVTIDGAVYYVPCNWGNISVIYRTDMVDPQYIDDPTWSILWDERYKGQICLRDDVQTACVVAGLLIGAANPWDMTDDELVEVRSMLLKQKELQRFYWTDNTTMEQAVAAGEVVAATGWNSSYLSLKREGIPVGYMVPREGILTWVDGVSLLKGGEGPEEKAYDFIDAWISPESGKFVIEDIGFGHSNRIAYEIADPAVLAEADMTDPISVLKAGRALQPIDGPLMQKYTNLFDEVKVL